MLTRRCVHYWSRYWTEVLYSRVRRPCEIHEDDGISPGDGQREGDESIQRSRVLKLEMFNSTEHVFLRSHKRILCT